MSVETYEGFESVALAADQAMLSATGQEVPMSPAEVAGLHEKSLWQERIFPDAIPETEVFKDEAAHMIRQVLGKMLNERNHAVFTKWLGLDGGTGTTLAQLHKEFGVSTSRVIQIVASGRRRLLMAGNTYHAREALDGQDLTNLGTRS